MAIPTEDDFTLAIERCEQMQSMEFPLEVSEGMFLQDGPAQPATRSILDCLSAQEEAWSELSKLTALKWLANDRFACRAYVGAMKPKKDWLTSTAAADAIHLSVARTVRLRLGLYGPTRQLVSTNVSDQQVEDEVRRYSWQFRPSAMQWAEALLPAYQEYLHRPDAVGVFLSEERRIQALARQAIAGENALRELCEIAGRRGSFLVDKEKADRRVDQRIRFVARAREEVRWWSIPISRRDRTARERLLLWRLWKALTRDIGAARPTTMKNLLRVEGVENEMDDSSVDAAIKKYTEQRAKRIKRNRESWLDEWELKTLQYT